MRIVNCRAYLHMMVKSSYWAGKEKHQEQRRQPGNSNRERYRPLHQRGEGFHSRARHLLLREVGGRLSFGIVVGSAMR